MKKYQKRNKSLILRRVNLEKAEYEQWKYRISRALKTFVRSGGIFLTNNDMFVALQMICENDEYLTDRFVESTNERYHMTLPTWSETKEYIESRKIL